MSRFLSLIAVGWAAGFLLIAAPLTAAEPSLREQAAAGLRNAVEFYATHCGKQGGYVWRTSRDLKLSEGEGETDEATVWVQPPGTPSVGMALLDAFEATGDPYYLDQARATGRVLLAGQMQTGGWYYSIVLDPARRDQAAYRDQKWRKGKQQHRTTLDDNTTQEALRFLIRLDKTLDRKEDGADKAIGEAVEFSLKSLLAAQAPNGGWAQNWKEVPRPKSEAEYPIKPASYPDEWLRKWPNTWKGVYFLNDDVAGQMIDVLLAGWRAYGDRRWLDAARRTGDFLILAQMPDPQPAWAQQYDAQMHPVWDRKFEPPAISGSESQMAIASLLELYNATGEAKYLDPIPRAIDYLRRSQLKDGRLARFYELKTNRPLYFTRDYRLVYTDDDLPTHYAFIVGSKLDALEREYRRAVKDGPRKPSQRKDDPEQLAGSVRTVLAAMDDRGGWLERRSMKGFKKASPEGVYQSETFNANVKLLSRYLRATGSESR